MNNSTTKLGSFFLTILLISVTTLNIKAQLIKADSIFWNTGDVSLLNDLGRVWIILKKGNDIKDARIVEIKKERSILVYEKEKCLHDISISNIRKILAGKNSISGIYFNPDNTPYINREVMYVDPLVDYSDFKSLKVTKKSTAEIKAVKTQPVIAAPTNEEIVCDTLIEENGHRLLIKIVSVDPKFLYYRKIKDLSGPIYVRCSDKAFVTRYSKCTTVNFLKNQ